jgi:hypothetical protein
MVFASRWLAALCAISLTAAIIDEIAVTVGNQAITEGEITREIRLSSLLNGEAPDYSLDSRRRAAGRLIEQALIRREMSFGSYPPISPQQVDDALADTRKARGGASALNDLLQRQKLTLQDLRDYLTWQLELLKFIDLRFRPAVQVTPEDVEKYYRDTIVPASPPGKAPALNDVREDIDKKLTAERVDQQLDDWIKRSRSRSVIRYIDSGLSVEPNAQPSR